MRAEGLTIVIKAVQVQSPSSRSGSTLYKVRGRTIVPRRKYEKTFKGDETVEIVDFEKKEVQFLFSDADSSTFMDKQTYEQYILNNESIVDEMHYISDGLEGLQALIADEQVLGIELPSTVELAITETAPAMKAASASARNKPATLSTGLVIQVPEYLAIGERVKVNTESGDYISRA